jgi:hypothetical protein
MWFRSEQKENKRLKALEEGLESAERELHRLDLDMHLLWDKVKVALGRISKRAAILEKTETQTTPTEEAPVMSEAPSLPGRMWNQHQIEEQQRILRRRAGL